MRAALARKRQNEPTPRANEVPLLPSWLVIATLTILTMAVFGRVVTHEFVHFDDNQFVYENEWVKKGLAAESVKWALTSAQLGYYPLTWLSHMADAQIFGMKAGGHLATAVALHILSSILLFLALRELTGAAIRSAFVAALFAIHPMHVESVAWVSERKDTLSTVFGILAILLYARRRMVGVALALAASLLSKQMLITLPFVLLLLDWWPLRRLNRKAVIEKIPLFVLTIIGAILAVFGQRSLNAVQTAGAVPLGDRIANALVAYAKYVGKLFWPTEMAPMYPLQRVAMSDAVASAILLIAISAAVWIYRRRAPYLLVGWLWFLGTLVPVIGLVQIGAQSMADRYTYFPYIGLFIAIVWWIADSVPHRVAVGAGAVLVLLLAFIAFRQTGYWANSDRLFTHTLQVTGPNPMAEYALGRSLHMSDPDRAIPHLRRAVELTDLAMRANPNAPKPDIYAQSHVAIGTALLMKARATQDPEAKAAIVHEAAEQYQTALKIDPTADNAKRNLALAQSMAPKEPVEKTINRLIDEGFALMKERKNDAAIARFEQAVQIAPASVEARVYLAFGFIGAERRRDAAVQLHEAKKIDAAKANRYVSGMMKLPPGDENLHNLIATLEKF